MSLFSRIKSDKKPQRPPERLTLTIELESPPVSLYGSARDSTGSILSGVLNVDIAKATVEKVVLRLVQTIHLAKPLLVPAGLISSCAGCTTRKTDLARWDVLVSPKTISGNHEYPFSYLVPGLLAALAKLGLAHTHSYIRYDLEAEAVCAGQTIKATLPINISRLILRGPDRNLLRIFPPTDVTASAVLPNVMYPKLAFPIELRLDNVVSRKRDRRWRMRRLTWKLEEHTKVRAYACGKHAAKLKLVEEGHKRQGQRDGPSKSAGLHHLTVQTLMYLALDGADVEAEPEPEQEQEPVESDTHGFDEYFGGLGPAHTNTSVQLPERDLLFLDELRVVAHGEMKLGWKLDFLEHGRIELVAEISAMECLSGLSQHTHRALSADAPPPPPRSGANILCDIDDPELGVYVSHVLVVEIVVAEELVHHQRPPDSVVGVPTGAARVLRMQFRIVVTERSGLGIAWDDEVPPLYEDVRALSPPVYELARPLRTTLVEGVAGTDAEIQELRL